MRRTARGETGFTLVEILVAATLSAFVMSALLSCFVFLGRNFTRLANHQMLEQQSRSALARLQSDFNQASSIKRGTSPTAESVTLVLPAGEVTYSYDPANQRLRRQATFGATPDLVLLNNNAGLCRAFRFSYYTGTLGSAADQVTPSQTVPYSIKHVQVEFTLETPAAHSPQTRVEYDAVSARFQIRQKQAPDGN